MSTQSKERLAVDLEFTDAVITLVDTARDNAMSPEMGEAVVDKLKTSADLRCAIVRGAGKYFSIGGARDMLSSLADTRCTAEDRERFRLLRPLADAPRHTRAGDRGDRGRVHRRGAGLRLRQRLDIADDTAKFQITFTALGLFPGMAMSYLMPLCAGR